VFALLRQISGFSRQSLVQSWLRRLPVCRSVVQLRVLQDVSEMSPSRHVTNVAAACREAVTGSGGSTIRYSFS